MSDTQDGPARWQLDARVQQTAFGRLLGSTDLQYQRMSSFTEKSGVSRLRDKTPVRTIRN